LEEIFNDDGAEGDDEIFCDMDTGTVTSVL
jgi:hypothetical protein